MRSDAPLSQIQLIKLASRGEALPLPKHLLEQKDGAFLAFGYVLGLQDQGTEFARGIRAFIKSGNDTTVLRDYLEQLEKESLAIEHSWVETFFRGHEQELRGPLAPNVAAAMAAAFYGSITSAIGGGPLAAICTGLVAALAVRGTATYAEYRLAIKDAGQRARAILSILPHTIIQTH